MNKIKVLCITRKYPPQVGGMENFSYNLLTGLNREAQVEAKVISLSKTQKHLVWFFPYACIYTLFNARKYDVVFIGDAVLCFLGTISKIIAPETKRIINVFGLDLSFPNAVYQLYLKMFYKKCSDLFISISKDTNSLLYQRWGSLNACIITPGIVRKEKEKETKQVLNFKSKYGIPEENIILLTVGRLVKRKGVAWFVQEVMPLLREMPISYFVIGDGKERDHIKEILKESKQEGKVHLLGRVEQKVLDDFYKNADIFIMPNIEVDGDKEGFGIVAAEASMAGLIVIASGIEGISDAIVDEKNGYLLSSADTEAYKEKIIDICTNLEIYKQKAQKFSKYTEENYNWEFICKKYVEEMKKLMQGDEHE